MEIALLLIKQSCNFLFKHAGFEVIGGFGINLIAKKTKHTAKKYQ